MAFTKYKTISILLVAISASALLYFTFFKKKSVLPEKFSWGTAVSDKYLWPMMVSTARFIEPDGLSIEISEFGPEQEAPLTGKWAIGNGAKSSYNEPLPARIYVEWLSLRERKWYKAEFDLPRNRLDSIFRKVQGNQLVLGLAPHGELTLWINGRLDKAVAANFTARAYEPDWSLQGNSNPQETEVAFVDRIYQKVGEKERNAIDAVVPLADQKAINGVYNGIYEFIALQDIDDEHVLIVRKLKDTMALVYPAGMSATFAQGDLIHLQWKMGKQAKNDDPTVLQDRQFALSTALYKKGKLSSLMIKGLPSTAAFYHTERMTPQGRQIMQNSVNYYLANSSDSDIRRAVDKNVVPLRFTVNDKLIGGVKGFEINITTDEDDPAFSKTVYFHPRNLYYLMDGNELKQFGL